MKRIKVLVVDDSAVARTFLMQALAGEKDIEVVGGALDPFIAADKIKTLHPDVLTLDIEMPRMDGLTFLQKLMLVRPMPVIMVSSLTDSGTTETLKAMEAGAVDFILKPKNDADKSTWKGFGQELAEKIRVASKAHIFPGKPHARPETRASAATESTCDGTGECTQKLIAIGASTGGTEVITRILSSMPANAHGIVITQHMPPKFTEAFASRVNSLSKITVSEARHGDLVRRGCAYIAPGGQQMLVRRSPQGYWLEVNDDPPYNRHKPSVDLLFNSVAETAAGDAIGVICTGMGNDGADGLREMAESGAMTIAQSEESCVVFGMPREAIKIGAARKVYDIEGIISYLIQSM